MTQSLRQHWQLILIRPSPRTHMHLVRALHYARRFEQWVRAGRAELDVCPDPYIAFYTGFSLIALGKPEEALHLAEKTPSHCTPQFVETAMRAFIAASAGQKNVACEILLALSKKDELDMFRPLRLPGLRLAWLTSRVVPTGSCWPAGKVNVAVELKSKCRLPVARSRETT